MLLHALLAVPFVAPTPQIESAESSGAALARCAAFLARDLVDHENVPGIALCIRRDGKTLVELATGDGADGKPLATGDALPLGSWTRLVWTAATLRLVSMGKLAFEDDVRERLPELAKLAHPVRVRQLLEGTAGIAPWSEVLAASKKKPGDDIGLAEALEILAVAPFTSAPGEAYAPNGAAWSLLPILVGRLTGDDVGWTQDNVLATLTPQGIELAPCATENAALGLAFDCDKVSRAHDLEVELALAPHWPAPPWCGTALDVARFGEALIGERLANGDPLARWTHAAKLANGKSTEHGYALDLGALAEHPRWFHDGGIGAHRVRMACYPSDELVVSVIATCSSAPVARLEEDLARLALGLPSARVLDLPLADAAPFTGAFQIGTTRLRVLERDGRLVLQEPERELELLWQGGLSFVARNEGSVRVEFTRAQTRIDGFELRQGSTTQRATRMDGARRP